MKNILLTGLMAIGITNFSFSSFNGQKMTRCVSESFTKTDTTTLTNFVFKDQLNKDVRLSDFSGKLVVVDIWYSGCGACIECNNGLKIVHEQLKNENITFVSLCVDKDSKMWKLSIGKRKKSKVNPWAGKYRPADGTITLFTGGTGSKNDFIRKCVPKNSYPQLLVIGVNGEILSTDPPRPDHQPESLVSYLTLHM
ncbi:peroxiredoxin family protein [Mucilaginibacter sp. UYCu711]|uniref:peroxiredoxin family protein n=1 Tax=Mucilaginibacter sp. UYCu711 TaxID=3156339 RepID=UPI003D1942F6